MYIMLVYNFAIITLQVQKDVESTSERVCDFATNQVIMQVALVNVVTFSFSSHTVPGHHQKSWCMLK